MAFRTEEKDQGITHLANCCNIFDISFATCTQWITAPSRDGDTDKNANSPKGEAANSTNRSLFHILTTSDWQKHVKKRPRRNVPHFRGRTLCHPEGTRRTQPSGHPPHTPNQHWREHVKRRPRRTNQQQRLLGRTPLHPTGGRRTQPTGRFSTYLQPSIGRST